MSLRQRQSTKGPSAVHINAQLRTQDAQAQTVEKGERQQRQSHKNTTTDPRRTSSDSRDERDGNDRSMDHATQPQPRTGRDSPANRGRDNTTVLEYVKRRVAWRTRVPAIAARLSEYEGRTVVSCQPSPDTLTRLTREASQSRTGRSAPAAAECGPRHRHCPSFNRLSAPAWGIGDGSQVQASPGETGRMLWEEGAFAAA